MCLKDCHHPELQWCWNEGRLVKLLVFCLIGRNFDQFFFVVFLLFSCRKKCVIACAKRKRPPLVRGHHWSPASSVTRIKTMYVRARSEVLPSSFASRDYGAQFLPAVHCKKIRRFYGKIPGNQLPVHIPLFLRASACRTFLEIKKW